MIPCPSCGADVSSLRPLFVAELAQKAGLASGVALGKAGREARARKAGLANRKRSKAAKALTSRLKSAALKAYWAKKKAEA